MKSKDKTSNVIKFPNVEKLLVEKGLDCLEKKKFRDAIRFIEEARGDEPYNEQLLIGLVIAYFEADYLTEAKAVARDLLQKGIGDYDQVIDLYVMILLQLHEYEEVIAIIRALLEEQHFSSKQREHYQDILIFSEKMCEQQKNSPNDDTIQKEASGSGTPFLDGLNEQQQLEQIKRLAEQNIRPYLQEIADFLQAESAHPFLKTLLLHILKEQEVEREFTVTKFGESKTIAPLSMPDIPVQLQIDITTILQEVVASDNPVLYENIHSLVTQHFFLLYPIEFPSEEAAVWAAAYHLLGYQYYGYESAAPLSEVASIYEVPEEQVEQSFQFILLVEKNTFSK